MQEVRFELGGAATGVVTVMVPAGKAVCFETLMGL
jgi:hypothetical protein